MCRWHYGDRGTLDSRRHLWSRFLELTTCGPPGRPGQVGPAGGEPGLQSQTEQVCTLLCPSRILDPMSVSLAAPHERGLLTGFLSAQGLRGTCADPLFPFAFG